MAILGVAWAQTMVEDMDGDGMYSMEELQAVYPELTEVVMAQIDVNEDGSVDEDELEAAIANGLLSG